MMSPNEKRAYLDALRDGALVRAARAASGRCVYRDRKRDPEFDAACKEIIKARSYRPVGFVAIEPYRAALHTIPPEQRRFARHEIGMTKARWGSYMAGRQRSISIADANRIAMHLARPDLYVDEDANTSSAPEVATVPNVGQHFCEVSGLTTATEMLRRAELARRALRFDSSIHPLDALAMVVWPPERFLEDAA